MDRNTLCFFCIGACSYLKTGIHFSRTCTSLRLVAKDDRVASERRRKAAADAGARLRIVIAGDPDPVAPALQGPQGREVARSDARRSFAIMEAVAERDHQAR